MWRRSINLALQGQRRLLTQSTASSSRHALVRPPTPQLLFTAVPSSSSSSSVVAGVVSRGASYATSVHNSSSSKKRRVVARKKSTKKRESPDDDADADHVVVDSNAMVPSSNNNNASSFNGTTSDEIMLPEDSKRQQQQQQQHYDSSQVAQFLRSTTIDSREHDAHRGIFPYRIIGSEMTAVEIDLQPGETIRAETGCLVMMDSGVEIDTSTGGGIGEGLKRLMTGENFFISDFVNRRVAPAPSTTTTTATTAVGEQQQQQLSTSALTSTTIPANASDTPSPSSPVVLTGVATVTLAASYPSKIVPIKLSEHGGALICQRGAFLCGAPSTRFEMYARHSLGAGFFGGEGFILQELNGDGLVLLRAGGSLMMRELAPGETIKMSSGTLVAFEQSVTFGIERLPGFKNMFLGGEGLFLSTLTGPGKVWLQSLPFNRLVDSIASHIHTGSYGSGLGLGGMGGGASTAGDAADAGGEEGAAVSGDEGVESFNEENLVEEHEEDQYMDDDDYVEDDDEGGGGLGNFFSSWFGSKDD